MDKMKMESPDMTAQNIDRIAALFPNCITEAYDFGADPGNTKNLPDHTFSEIGGRRI